MKKYKDRLGKGNIDEIRKFRSLLKKSGLTIEDCALGFRMINMLDKFYLHDDFEKPFTDSTLRGSVQKEETDISDFQELTSHFVTSELRDNDNVRSKGNEILSFIANIYEPCQRNNIKSTEIMKWIQDLLVNFSHNDISEIKKERNGGKDNFSNKEQLIEIPLITQVDTFVEGKKHQYSDLRNKISELDDVLNKVSEKIIQKSDHLKKIEEKEKETIQYLHWYKNLKDALKKNSGIGIEQVIEDFVKMIKEFQDHDFNTIEFIQDYRKMKSLKRQMISIQTDIDQKVSLRANLNDQLTMLNSKVMEVNQTLTNYNILSSMGFGLKELKYLSNTLREITLANNIANEEAVQKFLADIEKDYDNKLGFEKSVKLLEDKKRKIEAELPEYPYSLQMQAAVGESIRYVKDQGVTDSDIIGMNNLVHDFVNNNLLFGYDHTDIVRANPWYFFIQELTTIKDLRLEIKNLTTIRDNLIKENNSSQISKEPATPSLINSILYPKRLKPQTNQEDMDPN